MEYISAEEFLKQPREVQNVFNEWWAPEKNDLYFDESDETVGECFDHELEGIYYSYRDNMSYREDINPLLTEGQLRKFIEDKMKGKINIDYNKLNGYGFLICGFNGRILFYNALGADLLQAYWKVVIEIAKEELSNE